MVHLALKLVLSLGAAELMLHYAALNVAYWRKKNATIMHRHASFNPPKPPYKVSKTDLVE
jgi:hypothetical protein